MAGGVAGHNSGLSLFGVGVCGVCVGLEHRVWPVVGAGHNSSLSLSIYVRPASLLAVVGRWTAAARRSSFLCSVAACRRTWVRGLKRTCKPWAACGLGSESGGLGAPQAVLGA